jgi:hypothetical protein
MDIAAAKEVLTDDGRSHFEILRIFLAFLLKHNILFIRFLHLKI